MVTRSWNCVDLTIATTTRTSLLTDIFRNARDRELEKYSQKTPLEKRLDRSFPAFGDNDFSDSVSFFLQSDTGCKNEFSSQNFNGKVALFSNQGVNPAQTKIPIVDSPESLSNDKKRTPLVNQALYCAGAASGVINPMSERQCNAIVCLSPIDAVATLLHNVAKSNERMSLMILMCVWEDVAERVWRQHSIQDDVVQCGITCAVLS